MIELDINEHGIKGSQKWHGVFVPECCLNCGAYDWEATQDGFGETFYWCNKRIRFPVKKGTCKRQVKIGGGQNV